MTDGAPINILPNIGRASTRRSPSGEAGNVAPPKLREVEDFSPPRKTRTLEEIEVGQQAAAAAPRSRTWLIVFLVILVVVLVAVIIGLLYQQNTAPNCPPEPVFSPMHWQRPWPHPHPQPAVPTPPSGGAPATSPQPSLPVDTEKLKEAQAFLEKVQQRKETEEDASNDSSEEEAPQVQELDTEQSMESALFKQYNE